MSGGNRPARTSLAERIKRAKFRRPTRERAGELSERFLAKFDTIGRRTDPRQRCRGALMGRPTAQQSRLILAADRQAAMLMPLGQTLLAGRPTIVPEG